MIDPALLSLFSKGRVKFRRNSFLLRLQWINIYQNFLTFLSLKQEGSLLL